MEKLSSRSWSGKKKKKKYCSKKVQLIFWLVSSLTHSFGLKADIGNPSTKSCLLFVKSVRLYWHSVHRFSGTSLVLFVLLFSRYLKSHQHHASHVFLGFFLKKKKKDWVKGLKLRFISIITDTKIFGIPQSTWAVNKND